ncbi:thiamine phosphate synthase [Exiguobacterium antarcticum]|uniref:Thiamine-phosphate synthase n=1 Tax=Exiguobacterium antarcticum TaxID=132920 RepID=A0ABT6R579_9BACL|nr:thiamine phosphate synthase [Exiguobacterium antarcticum]AFS69672.1 Thiamine-phosphate synthase [Exiguobacterium antarcticum B7]MDI3235993.1 thiamine phosphate synthase [Exiguobacterium antarcticum]
METDYFVYAVTDRRFHPELNLIDAVEAALKGGATIVQLREKETSGKIFLEAAIGLKALTERYGVPLIINDRIDIAMLVGAGLHIGQEDIPLREARRLLPTAMIGVSVSTVEQALIAEREGANYLGVGSLFLTTTKRDATFMPKETLEAIRQAVQVPLVGIGGITQENIGELGSLVDGYAVISTLFAKKEIERATQEFREAAKQARQSISDRV